jgi:NNP family nitrate/nitrite transporter-like MFS transporter
MISRLLKDKYKWYVVILTMLTYGVIAGVERLCMPVLFKEISVDLNLSLVSLGTIWGADPLAGIAVGLVGGLLVDRFGLKRSLTVVCILAGIFSALRGLAIDFWSAAASMFLFGIMAAMTPAIVPKAAAVWFNREKLGLVNAIINVAWSIGGMLATMTSATLLSPWLGGWRNVLFLLGAPAVGIGLLWALTGREPGPDEIQNTQVSSVSFKEAISQVVRLKEVWLLGLISLALWGSNLGFIGYLPLYLQDQGWSIAAADGVITAFNGAYMLGIIPMTLIANRFRAHKFMLFFTMAVTAVFMAAVPLVSDAALWPLVIIANFLRSSSFALTNVLIMEIPEVKGTYSGTAIGLVTSIGMVGGFAAPPLGNSFEQFGAQTPFFFWAALAACSWPLFLLLRKTHKPALSAG